MAMLPLYVPTESPLIFTPAEKDPLFDPVAAEDPLIVSHEMFDVAVQPRVPVPAFKIVTVWPAGFVPFCIAENVNVAGFRLIVGAVGAGAKS